MKSILKIFLFISVLFGTGKYGDAFLNLGTSARNIALGQALVADLQNPSGFNVSPAAVGGIMTKNVYGLFINQFGLAEYGSFGITIPLNKKLTLGINASGLLIDNIPERPDLRFLTDLEARRDSIRTLVLKGFDTFQDREFAATFTIAKMNHFIVNPGWQFATFPVRLPLGINIRILHKELHKIQATGIGVDFGMALSIDLKDVTRYPWLGTLSLGSSLNHILGTRLFWSSDKDELIPMQLITGLKMEQPVQGLRSTLAGYFQLNNQFPDEVQYGFEWTTSQRFAVRMGYQNDSIQGGLGIQFPLRGVPIRIDYSFSGHQLGKAHRIGGEFSF
jgi:hypothetical protein